MRGRALLGHHHSAHAYAVLVLVLRHSGQLLRLSYAGESAYQPILSHLIRELGLDLSILHGQIDEIQDQTFGSLAVYASGNMARIGAAIDYLRAQGVVVQTVEVKG